LTDGFRVLSDAATVGHIVEKLPLNIVNGTVRIVAHTMIEISTPHKTFLPQGLR
jgi:hypothetical protein